MNNMLTGVAALMATFAFTVAQAASETTYSLDDLSWLEGRWADHRDPEVPIEVRWNSKEGDAMVGSWRKTKNGALVAYEILTMRKIGGDVVYRFDLYSRKENDEAFSMTSSTRLKLLLARDNHAEFTVIGEENWRLTMDVEAGVLSGFMEDQNDPNAERFYSYVGRKQP